MSRELLGVRSREAQLKSPLVTRTRNSPYIFGKGIEDLACFLGLRERARVAFRGEVVNAS